MPRIRRARTRRRTLRRLAAFGAVTGGVLALRGRRLSENQRRFDLP